MSSSASYGLVNAIAAVDAVFAPGKEAYKPRVVQNVDFFPNDDTDSRAMNLFLAYVVSNSNGVHEAESLYTRHVPEVLKGLGGLEETERTRQVARWNAAISAFNGKLMRAFGSGFAPVFPEFDPPLVGRDQLSVADIASIHAISDKLDAVNQNLFDTLDGMLDVLAELGVTDPAVDAFIATVQPLFDGAAGTPLDSTQYMVSLNAKFDTVQTTRRKISDAYSGWFDTYIDQLEAASQATIVADILGSLS